jgi:hypothetical protein
MPAASAPKLLPRPLPQWEECAFVRPFLPLDWHGSFGRGWSGLRKSDGELSSAHRFACPNKSESSSRRLIASTHKGNLHSAEQGSEQGIITSQRSLQAVYRQKGSFGDINDFSYLTFAFAFPYNSSSCTSNTLHPVSIKLTT